MLLPDIALSKSSFENCQWKEAIGEAQQPLCSDYSDAFLQKSKKAEQAGEIQLQVALLLLYVITFPRLKADSVNQPFGFMESIENIKDEHLEILKDWISDIFDNELKARIADILWIRKRDYLMAQTAIDAYLESAKTLEDSDKWLHFVDRLERAYRLACQANQRTKLDKVITYIEAILDQYNGEDSGFASAKLMGILQDCKKGDPLRYALLSKKAAQRSEDEHDFHKARAYWAITINWYYKSRDTDEEKKAKIALAETYVKQADDALNRRNSPSYSVASHFLSKAITAYRKIGGCRTRIDEIHQSLLDYQEKSTSELIPSTYQQDVTDFVNHIIGQVKGKSLYDALYTFAIQLIQPPRVSEIKKQVQEQEKESAFSNLFPFVSLNDKGQVVGTNPSLEEKMFRHATFYQGFTAQAIIEPVRYQINLEHYCKIQDFYPIVFDNPFIPTGREDIYAQGLYAGLTRNFLVSTHLLVPQIEDSIREILIQQGAITSGINDDGTQYRHNINTFFKDHKSKLQEIFGEDLVFDLEGLLTREGFGSNLRNAMAHGFIDTHGFYAASSVYLWGITLHLCFLTKFFSSRKHSENDRKEENLSSNDTNV